ncbi:MAG TPA: hypothetical protein VLA16_22270 [Ideonella sp.]|nr:hypothetical protein [Ideonella sp.]
MTWSWHTRSLPAGEGLLARVMIGERRATVQQTWQAWRDDAEFRALWASWLRGVPFEAFLWETPPATSATLGEAFECVFLPSAALAQARPDPVPFAEHFERQPGAAAVVFESLGRDALLVAPGAQAPLAAYTHLAAFMRGAPAAQVDETWALVARQALARVGSAPLWLSTSGLGVYWLHFRLDSRPKYYQHRPYRAAP